MTKPRGRLTSVANLKVGDVIAAFNPSDDTTVTGISVTDNGVTLTTDTGNLAYPLDLRYSFRVLERKGL